MYAPPSSLPGGGSYRSAQRWMDAERWQVQEMEYHGGILPSVTTWLDLEGSVLREPRQVGTSTTWSPWCVGAEKKTKKTQGKPQTRRFEPQPGGCRSLGGRPAAGRGDSLGAQPSSRRRSTHWAAAHRTARAAAVAGPWVWRPPREQLLQIPRCKETRLL